MARCEAASASVGALAHLLKNRFYIGEVVYRAEVHPGEHEPILDRDLFEAVQARLAANGVARTLRLRGVAGILAGRIYDDGGNRMSPTHSNKLGVRYRYYVSRALLRSRGDETGSIPRVPAPEIEQLVVDGVRSHLSLPELPADLTERDLIERHVERVVITPTAVEVRLMAGNVSAADSADETAPGEITLTLAWTAPSFAAVKGIVHEPVAKPAMKPENRDALLAAIAKRPKTRSACSSSISRSNTVRSRASPQIRRWRPATTRRRSASPRSPGHPAERGFGPRPRPRLQGSFRAPHRARGRSRSGRTR